MSKKLITIIIALIMLIMTIDVALSAQIKPTILITRTDNQTYYLDPKDIQFDITNGIISVEQPPYIKYAEIWLDTKSKKKIASFEIKHRTNTLQEFLEIRPYCKNKTTVVWGNNTKEGDCNDPPLCLNREPDNITYYPKEVITEPDWNDCYNDLILNGTEWYIRVEHFSDYFVNGTDYDKLIDCMVAKNNTAHTCIVNEDGHTETFNKSYSFSQVIAEIGTGIDNVYLDFNNSINANSNLRTFTANNHTLKNYHIYDTGTDDQRHYYISGSNTTFYNMNSTRTSDDDYLNGNRLNMTDCHFNRTSLHMYQISYSNITRVTVENGHIRADPTGGRGIFVLAGSTTFNNHNNIINSTCIMSDNPTTTDMDSCFYFSTQYSNMTNLYAKGKTMTGIKQEGNGVYFNYIKDSFIHDSLKGIESGFINNYLINNTIVNTSEEGILNHQGAIGNNEVGGVHNNTITNSGTAIQTNSKGFLISKSPEEFGGNCYNGLVGMYKSDYSGAIVISDDNTNVSTVATGLNNFSLWLCSVGATRYTLLIEEPQSGALCTAVCGASSLNCDYAENNYLVANGATTNYTYNENTICSGTTPAYLRWANWTNQTQTYFPLVSYVTGNNLQNISGNIIQSNKTPHHHDAEINGSPTSVNLPTNIWLNHFRTGQPIIQGMNISRCVNNQGNFYQESLIPNSTDCGRANITSPYLNQSIDRHDNTINITWRTQDAITPIEYTVMWKENTSNWNTLGTTTSNHYIWDYTGLFMANSTHNITLGLRTNDGVVYGTNQTLQVWVTSAGGISDSLVLWVILMIGSCTLFYYTKDQVWRLIMAGGIFLIGILAISIQDSIITSFVMYTTLILFGIELIKTINKVTEPKHL